jgi:predicted RNase H-like HicB family nuclease
MQRILHTIVFREGDTFIASGVELDVVAQGKTQQEAERRLETVIYAELNEARETGRDIFEIGPAPEEIVSLFNQGSDDIVSQHERLVA